MSIFFSTIRSKLGQVVNGTTNFSGGVPPFPGESLDDAFRPVCFFQAPLSVCPIRGHETSPIGRMRSPYRHLQYENNDLFDS